MNQLRTAVPAFVLSLALSGIGFAQTYLEHVQKGDTAFKAGSYDVAVKEHQAALALLGAQPKVASAVQIRLAIDYQAMGQKSGARAAYEEAIRLDENNATALNNLAYELGDQEVDLDRALRYAMRASELMPDHNEVADTLAWVHLKRKETEPALAILVNLCEKYPTSATFQRHLGLALQQNGDRSGAIKAFRKALVFNPSDKQRKQIMQSLKECGDAIEGLENR